MNPKSFSRSTDEETREYLEFCEADDLDPESEESRLLWKEFYEELKKERAGHDWDQMSPEDSDGWTDNMNKDG